MLNEGAQGGGGEEEEKEKGKGQLSLGSILSCFMSVSQRHLSCPEEQQGSESKKISCSWKWSGTNPTALLKLCVISGKTFLSTNS